VPGNLYQAKNRKNEPTTVGSHLMGRRVVVRKRPSIPPSLTYVSRDKSVDNLWISLLSLCMVGLPACQIMVNQETEICADAENSARNAARRCSEKAHNECTKRTYEWHRSEADGDSRCHATDR